MAITVGLCRGRHDLPVDEYIFNGVLNPADIDGIDRAVNQWIWAHCKPHSGFGVGLNQADYTDVKVYKGEELIIYVTGLTVALTAVLSACAYNGIPVVLMHYDRDSGEYRQQIVFGRM